METVHCLALLQDVLSRPGFAEKIERHAGAEAPPAPGPDRRQLLELLAG